MAAPTSAGEALKNPCQGRADPTQGRFDLFATPSANDRSLRFCDTQRWVCDGGSQAARFTASRQSRLPLRACSPARASIHRSSLEIGGAGGYGAGWDPRPWKDETL